MWKAIGRFLSFKWLVAWLRAEDLTPLELPEPSLEDLHAQATIIANAAINQFTTAAARLERASETLEDVANQAFAEAEDLNARAHRAVAEAEANRARATKIRELVG